MPDPTLTERLAHLRAALAGRYRVDREIGAGGMATVYAAHDLRHDRTVAIKVLRPEVASAVGAERFLEEIRTTARLQHPNILPLFDSGEASGLLFFVMPMVTGETLRNRLERESPLPLDAALAIAGDLCSALDHAHRHGVVHRDIKPENILLQDGRAVLGDFGVALAARSGSGRLTESGISVGTPAYMSPEQILGESSLDARSDIYSAGTVIYEMLAGAPPFTAPTAQAIVARTLTETPARLSRGRRGIPATVDRAVMDALEKDPARRPQSAESLRAALTAPTAPARPRRRRWIAAAATVAVLVTGLLLGTQRRASTAPVIAILSFTNITGDTNNTALGQGLPLAIFDALRPLRLDVIPIETSADVARHYANDDAGALGRRLHATAMLLGKFEQDNGRVRIHVQFLDQHSGRVLWSNQFNGAANLFDLEDSVALAVAKALRVTLTGTQLATYRSAPTVPPEVHRTLVRARGYIERRDDESLHAGVDLLRDALAMDSSYAPAWALLARAHLLIAVYDGLQPDSDFSASSDAVSRALALDSTLAGAHLTRAVLHVFADHDYRAAAAEFQRSLALDPTNASTRLFQSWYYLGTGQPDSAVITIRLARRLDPDSPIIRAREGTVLYHAFRIPDAARALEQALVADSGNTFARRQLTEVYADDGRCDAARRVAAQLQPTPEQFENSLPWYARARCGDTTAARSFTRALEARAAQGGFVDPYPMARLYAALGDTARMWPSLDRAVTNHVWELWALAGDQAFASWRSDARFAALVNRARPR